MDEIRFLWGSQCFLFEKEQFRRTAFKPISIQTVSQPIQSDEETSRVTEKKNKPANLSKRNLKLSY